MVILTMVLTIALVVIMAAILIVTLPCRNPVRMMLLDPSAIMVNPPVRVVPLAIPVVITITIQTIRPNRGIRSTAD